MSRRDRDKKKPLYRKVNTKARLVHHRIGGDYRHTRNTKGEKASDAARGSMGAPQKRGLDYTPLFRFLLSKVGCDWDEVHGEAVSRLDRPDPIFWMVAVGEDERHPYVITGESSYFSGLYVDGDNTLQIVDSSVGPETMIPTCACCTHTFNGVPFVKTYEPPEL